MKVFGISAKTVPIGVHFFLMYAGIGPMAIFSSTIAKQFGFSTSTVGLIFFFVPLCSLFGRVILGMIADRYHLLKTIKIVCLTMCAVAVLIIALLPKRGVASMSTVRCDRNGTIVQNGQFDETFCSTTPTAQMDECQLSCVNNVNFQHMCSEWQKNLQNGTTFNCERISAELQYLKPSFSEHACGLAEIQKVKDGKSEILSPSCSTDQNSTCSIICTKPETSIGSELSMPSFWYLFILYVIFGVGYYVAVTFSDTICFQLIGEETYLYGRLRVPGSFGWGLGGFFTGILIDYFSNPNLEDKNYQPMFIFVVTTFLIDVLWSTKLKVDGSTSEKFQFRNVYQLFSRFDVVVFAIWSFLAGFFQQILWQYTYWYLDDISTDDDKDYLKTLQGFLSFSNTVTGDVISFSISGWLLKKLGYKNCMTMAMFLSAIRFYLYSIVTRPIWFIPVSSFDGIIYGLQYSLITSYCNVIAAPGTEATVQAVFNSIFDGIGTSVGGLFGGFFYNWYGGSFMFRANCFISIGAFALHLISRYVTTLRQ